MEYWQVIYFRLAELLLARTMRSRAGADIYLKTLKASALGFRQFIQSSFTITQRHVTFYIIQTGSIRLPALFFLRILALLLWLISQTERKYEKCTLWWLRRTWSCSGRACEGIWTGIKDLPKRYKNLVLDHMRYYSGWL